MPMQIDIERHELEMVESSLRFFMVEMWNDKSLSEDALLHLMNKYGELLVKVKKITWDEK